MTWLITFGQVQAVGVECTGSYGAGLTTVLSAAGLMVVEVNTPDRGTRHARATSRAQHHDMPRHKVRGTSAR
ncbi:hypothetical protein AB0I52_16055 [Streptomyces sp. NPDC050423]|uniref:hypothetical protein n=1 Tax=Streptomyces sp. NPDC050423 TaxID=3155402 RepID=UPI0034121ECC